MTENPGKDDWKFALAGFVVIVIVFFVVFGPGS